MTSIILIGGGGHARVLADCIRRLATYEIVGVVDPKLAVGSAACGTSVLGDDAVLPELIRRGVTHAAIGIGSMPGNNPRRVIMERIRALGFVIPTFVHPHTSIANDAVLAEGCQIMAGAIVQSGATLGDGTIVNTGASIDHDVRVGHFVHVCPGATICGNCTIGDGAFVGAGATIIHGIRIGAQAVVAAGAVVIRDVSDGVVVMGVPAQVCATCEVVHDFGQLHATGR